MEYYEVENELVARAATKKNQILCERASALLDVRDRVQI